MTAPRAALVEAQAFLDLFLKSDWKSCHVRGGAIEMFVAREAGHVNPMLGIVEAEVAAPAPAPAEETTLTAPHIGTLVELAAAGSTIVAGGRYGAIELLGETIGLIADRAGTIGRHIGRPGALVEYQEALATLH